MNIIWKGQYGEETAYMATGQICQIINGTTRCTRPRSTSIEKELLNPYEVYYIFLGNYRIEPPLRVRCCDPRYHGISAVYVEGFIPTLGRRVYTVTLGDNYIGKITTLVKTAGIDANGQPLIVEDVYFILDSNNTLLIPVLVLRHKNIRFWIGIEEKNPILLSYGSFMGSNGMPSDNDNGIRIQWGNIINGAVNNRSSPETTDYKPLGEGGNLVIYAITAIIAALMSMLYLWWRRK